MFKKINLFFTLIVATFENILCIPIVCKYLVFVVSMEIRKKNQSHVAIRCLRQNQHKTKIKSLGKAGNNEVNNHKPDHNHSELL
jgi:hypothetical protein